ncbi:MAG: GNAT family N-acetyltransferase [Saprospiraceae bacterium]|nr:GNAT family N-acetyltransferase [Saprospiraceae bacterium]
MPNSFFHQDLANDLVSLHPLKPEDFEALYAVASDPLIWEQHPNPNRYQRPVFQNFFEGALASGGAYLAKRNDTGSVIGSSRFYDYSAEEKSVFIGYTFIAREAWGKGFNPSMKNLMIAHAFEIVEVVYFHIGIHNIRSQIAIGKLGAEKLKTVEIAYHGEPTRINFEYGIKKEGWSF